MRQIQLKHVKLPNGETIAYREREGGEQKVLLVHGNMNSSKHWDVVLEKMDPNYKLYAMDMRGFGLSSYHTPISSIKELAEDIKHFADEIGLRDFSIVGWSLGGPVCMQFAADYPGYCKKMILLAPGSTRGYPIYETNESGQPDPTRRISTLEQTKNDPSKVVPTEQAYASENRGFLKMVYNAVIYTKNKPEPERYEEYIDDMLTQRNYAETVHALNTFNISGKFNGLIKGNGQARQIGIPVLVLLGDRDLVISKQMAEEIIEDIGENASFVELGDCGHSPPIDDIDQLLCVMSEFLN
ncbi:intracellular short-chain-length polyhydroxyalkanoate depolymerase [Cytobacillus oceanisediminis]|uniref:intracellular short-chain-length polyhydroxyalkanoate depolymerase n=1 Tax=Cytobacillus oceanisediminis TaxID=665099 RepID=UPI0037368F47